MYVVGSDACRVSCIFDLYIRLFLDGNPLHSGPEQTGPITRSRFAIHIDPNVLCTTYILCRLYLKENPMSFIILFLILSNE